jgi:DNA repair protein RadC
MARRRVPLLAQATAECEAEPQRDPGKGMSIREPEDVQAWATESGLVSRRYEEPWVLVLDRQSRLMHARRVSCGGPGGTHLELSDVIDAARNSGSPGFILVHNHPSGNPQPNKLDIQTTQELIELTKSHGMRLLDHVVVCPSRFMSMKNEGLLAA